MQDARKWFQSFAYDLKSVVSAVSGSGGGPRIGILTVSATT
jgi:hypothetical protein